jgi:hypothetical protein
VQLLLESQVLHIPGVTAMLRQHRFLLSGRKQAVTRHLGNVTATADKLPKGQGGVSFRPKPRASTLHGCDDS